VFQGEQKGAISSNETPINNITLWNVGLRPVPNLMRQLSDRRLRLGAPKFLFHADRIDQIAAVATVTCTDRSKSRWNKRQRAKGRGTASKLNPQLQSTNLMT
jgi:hypothetical protein